MEQLVSAFRPEALQQQVQAQLRQVFGLRRLRPGQRDVIDRVLRGQSTLAVMPTGAGKSLCYQLPALLLEGITVVVSPLIALMADQYRRLLRGGHPAAMIASGMEEEAVRASLRAVRGGEARIVFCSPERFASAAFLAAQLRSVAAVGARLSRQDEFHGQPGRTRARRARGSRPRRQYDRGALERPRLAPR